MLLWHDAMVSGCWSSASREKTVWGLGGEYARQFLERKGYSILESNYRGQSGEIDLVAMEGECLVFVEVKSRRTGAFGRPEESVTEAKQQKLVQAALEYMQEKEIEEGEWRIDVVGIEAGGARPRVRLVRNAVAWEEGDAAKW